MFKYCIPTVYLQSDADIFKTDAVPEAQTVDYSGIRHPPIFQAVAKFLYQTAIDEIGTGEQEAFTRWQGRAPEFDEQFSNEIYVDMHGSSIRIMMRFERVRLLLNGGRNLRVLQVRKYYL